MSLTSTPLPSPPLKFVPLFGFYVKGSSFKASLSSVFVDLVVIVCLHQLSLRSHFLMILTKSERTGFRYIAPFYFVVAILDFIGASVAVI